MECSLKAIVDNFGEGLRAIDATGIPHKSFKPGIGPYGEAEAVRLALRHMQILQIKLTLRVERRIEGLIHPVHQVLRVFGWEILLP